MTDGDQRSGGREQNASPQVDSAVHIEAVHHGTDETAQDLVKVTRVLRTVLNYKGD